MPLPHLSVRFRPHCRTDMVAAVGLFHNDKDDDIDCLAKNLVQTHCCHTDLSLRNDEQNEQLPRFLFLFPFSSGSVSRARSIPRVFLTITVVDQCHRDHHSHDSNREPRGHGGRVELKRVRKRCLCDIRSKSSKDSFSARPDPRRIRI